MKIRHLNCGTLCPRFRRFLNGDGELFGAGRMVCHCLLVEAPHGLVLVYGDRYSCPPLLRAFQNLMQTDGSARRANQRRLRELAQQHGGELEIVCAHDAAELDAATACGA